MNALAKFLGAEAKSKTAWAKNMIVLGDFNIFSTSDATMRALTEDGDFAVPEGVKDLSGTNLGRNRKYDQIAYRAKGARFESTGRAGAFDYYEHVFKADDSSTYRPYIDEYIEKRHAAGKKSPKKPADAAAALSQFKTWRTYQMSDHLPLWAEFRVDFSDDYLREIEAGTP
jgi:hypothetical protein